MRLFGTGPPGGLRGEVPGKNPISLDLKAPVCEKIDILNTCFLSEFSQYNDDFYGDLYGDFYSDFYGIVGTFVATNFLISLSSSVYMIFILLSSQRASLAKRDLPQCTRKCFFTKQKDSAFFIINLFCSTFSF